MDDLQSLFEKINACRACAGELDLGPRPIVRASATARLLIIGQAPGVRVHESGVPWNDASGDRLRAWMHVDQDTFYDENRIAVMPMGFCYPGHVASGGDKPPRRECAPKWHDRLLAHMKDVELILLVGSYAQKYYLTRAALIPKRTMSDTVYAWAEYGPRYWPLPHPSWRNSGWLKKNPWFEAETLPQFRRRVANVLCPSTGD